MSSTKGSTGHLLGGAGSVEAIISVQSLVHRTVPQTLNLEVSFKKGAEQKTSWMQMILLNIICDK